MTEETPPQDQNEPATGPVLTSPQAPPVYPPMPPQPAYIEQSNRLNKVAAWVGIVAGSLFIVVVIFGAGFVTGKAVGNNHRGDYGRGHEIMRPGGMPMMPMMPPGGFQRGPGSPGPMGPGGPLIEIPRQPGGASSAPDTSAPPRP